MSAEYWKREFSAEQREKLSESGAAMPDGSFPIVTKGDLSNAIQAFGRAKNKAATAKHIKARARALGATDMLPEEGQLAKMEKAGHRGKLRRGKKRRMTKFEINELSSVDFPAQEGARSLIMKRRDPVSETHDIRKEGGLVLLTTEEDGHAHGFWMFPGDQGGSTWDALRPDSDEEHDHAWVVDDEGTLKIAVNAGHGHTVERPAVLQAFMAISASMRSDDAVIAMARKCRVGFTESGDIIDLVKSGDPGKEDDEMSEELDAMKAKLERAEKVAELTDGQKLHFENLTKKGQTTFLAKSSEDRQSDVDKSLVKAATSDPVVYTDLAGSEYRKSDDPRLVKSVQHSDELAKRLMASEAVNKNAEFEKRADEHLPNLPGTTKVRAAIVKAIDGIEDEELRTLAAQSVIAGSRANKAAFETQGHGDGQIPIFSGGSVNKLDGLAKARQSKDGGNYEDAYAKVCDENPELAEAAILGSN